MKSLKKRKNRKRTLPTKGTRHLKGHSKPTKRTREQEEVTGAKKSKV